MKDLESLRNVEKELETMQTMASYKLTVDVQKHLDVQDHLSRITRAIKFAGNQVKIFQDGNNRLLTETISVMEKKNSETNLVALERENNAATQSVRTGIIVTSNQFVVDQSLFIVRLYHRNALYEEIHIKPAPTFQYPRLTKKLAEFCRNNQKHFGFDSVHKVSLISALTTKCVSLSLIILNMYMFFMTIGRARSICLVWIDSRTISAGRSILGFHR